MEKRERTFELKAWLVVALLGGALLWALAQEEIILTTYYPSPRGVYHELRTAGDVRIGDIEAYAPPAFQDPGNPGDWPPRLHLLQASLGPEPAFRVDDAPPDLFGDYDASPFLIDTNGNVGIGTTSPGNKLDVQGGDVNTSGKVREGGNPLIPAGAVMFFNLTTGCPNGWSEMTGARGRYLVGVQPDGGGVTRVGRTVGSALTDPESDGFLENREVGQHSHGVTDSGHSHFLSNVGDPGPGNNVARSNTHVEGRNTGSASSNIAINTTGSVAGTNAPYIQLLVCQKN
jgi:hypothetical protein